MDTIKSFCELTGVIETVAAAAGPDWLAIARIPVKRHIGPNAGAFCYRFNRVTLQRSNERVTLHAALSAEHLTETLLHEIAHILDVYQHGYRSGRGQHGPSFSAIARAIGCSSDACGTVLEGSAYLRDSCRFQYRCKDCGHVIRKYRRPRWDHGATLTAAHASCRSQSLENAGRLVRMTDEDIELNKTR